MRKIIHLDMDAFFASVEQRDFPEYRNKPLAVGGSEDRGVIAAASYEARKFGVFSAMSSKRAKELCPDLIFAKHRFPVYKDVSKQINKVFERYTDLIEPLSLDEAFLDITENKMGVNSATFIAQSIKNDVFNETGLTVSAGVSYNKFLAKMASDMDKPNGLYIIEPEMGQDFIDRLKIEKFFGVGKATAAKMKELGIFKGKDLKRFEMRDLEHYFGKSGRFFYRIARGIDERPVRANRERKSVGVENTFSVNINDEAELWDKAKKLLRQLWDRTQKSEHIGRTLSIKVRFDDFSTSSRSKTKELGINDEEQLMDCAVMLFNQFLPIEKAVRLLGFSLSGFEREEGLSDSQIILEF
jgi:DNA polymerase-4